MTETVDKLKRRCVTHMNMRILTKLQTG